VALPQAAVPLHIFEARYRVLFSTLLAGADGCVTIAAAPYASTRI
jgi:Lon protease-like protein